MRQIVEQGELAALSVQELNRFRDARRRFVAPRLESLYASWLVEGDAVFAEHPERALASATQTGRGGLETRTLTHSYGQFGTWPGWHEGPPSKRNGGPGAGPRGGPHDGPAPLAALRSDSRHA